MTHAHLDHGGATATLSKVARAPVYVHPRGAKHIAEPEKLWQSAIEVVGVDAAASLKPWSMDLEQVVAVEDNEGLRLGTAELIFIHTPGHASHHMVVWLPSAGIVFTGDAAGLSYDGCVAPSTPPPFYEKM